MEGFVDPRSTTGRDERTPAPRTTTDPAELEELHLLCRQGRLYDVERWIIAQRPLQLHGASHAARTGRHRPTALEIALKQHNHALALLLLCNGYDVDLEPRCALDQALGLRRPDLVALLLDWGADPHRVDLDALFDTYDSALFDRFYGLGVDLCRRHAFARALGEHTSNKPLFGFAKRYGPSDARIQQELDMALAHHAWRGNEKGAMLCLWAGGAPHANVPSLQDDGEEDDEAADENGTCGSALAGACCSGQAALLQRFAPDPARCDFDSLFSMAYSPAVVDVLARLALPGDMTAVVLSLVQGSAWHFGKHDVPRALRRLFEHGARWMETPTPSVGELRRLLLRLGDGPFKELVLVLGAEDYCSAEIRRELARTEAFQKRMRGAGLLPKTEDLWWQRRSGAEQQRVMMAAFNVAAPAKPQRRR